MSAPCMVSVFIPCRVLSELPKSCFILGHSLFVQDGFLINCNIFVKNVGFRNVEDVLGEANDLVEVLSPKKPMFGFLGVLYCAKNRKDCLSDDFKLINKAISLVLRMDYSTYSFHVEDIFIKTYDKKNLSCQIILYDNVDLLKSQMFCRADRFENKNCESNFINFLLKTLRCDRNSKPQLCNSDHIIFDGTELSQTYLASRLLPYLIIIASALLTVLSLCTNLMPSIPSGVRQGSFKLVTSTSVGCQFYQRFLHCEKIITELKTKNYFNLQ
ncbi:hypothetical protein TNCV_444121 [Trichonephila clavipes]|nr:hypothetical protein TNCV_444121 [Trichonephila clavipes]